jgi:hypothetical protein
MRQQAERGSEAERHRRRQDVRLPPAPPAPSPDIPLEDRGGEPEDPLPQLACAEQQPPARAAEPEPPRPPVLRLAPVEALARPPLPAPVGGYTYLRAGSGVGGTLQLRGSPSDLRVLPSRD